MVFPSISDTIVAISTGWAPRAVGVVRLSGPDALPLAESLGARFERPTADPRWLAARVALGDEISVPSLAYMFRRPRSYTGQDVVELHLPGNLALLRAVSARLIECGARRALPGEFTARAYLAGKLDAAGVEDVLALLSAAGGAAERGMARARRVEVEEKCDRLRGRIADLLALVEAGHDFADEEDIRFIGADELRAAVMEMLAWAEMRPGAGERLGRPHVALAGLPNAGKSTLFNALIGSERAIVSPVLGTTRDVLSAETDAAGVGIVLQDCAGLGGSADELELAAHVAAERAMEQADVVVWVHAADKPWTDVETESLGRIPEARRLIVFSKSELGRPEKPLGQAAGVVRVSAGAGLGLDELRHAIGSQLDESGTSDAGYDELKVARDSLLRTQALVDRCGRDLRSAELIALELREAYAALSGPAGGGPDAEVVLGRIFRRFCVGK